MEGHDFSPKEVAWSHCEKGPIKDIDEEFGIGDRVFGHSLLKKVELEA